MIHDLPVAERPRERLQQFGAEHSLRKNCWPSLWDAALPGNRSRSQRNGY